METNKTWFERQEEIFKRKAEEDFKEWKKKDQEMWDAYLDRLRTGLPVNCGDGIFPMIEQANAKEYRNYHDDEDDNYAKQKRMTP